MLTITGKVVGRKKPLFADWSVPFPPDLREGGEGPTLRDLITRIVHAEVDAFRQRQEDLGQRPSPLSGRRFRPPRGPMTPGRRTVLTTSPVGTTSLRGQPG